MLELDFTLEQKLATDAQTNPTYYAIQVAKKAKDPSDNKKEILVFLEDQLMVHHVPSLELVRSQDLKSIGIKTDKTGLSPEEKVALRKRFLCYKHTALMVTDSTKTVEAVDNCDVLVTVDTIEDIEVAEIVKGVCECIDNNLIWGNKVNCEFRKKVIDICKDLWPNNYKEMANGLMAVMKAETDGTFKAHQIMGKSLKDAKSLTKDDFWLKKKDGTKTSRAVGLIQFTLAALVQIKEFKEGSGFDKLHEVKLKFAQMGEIKQLDYVKKYFIDSKDKIKSPEDIYLHVFAPKGVGKPDDYILYDKDIDGEKFIQNKSLDKENNNDGKIQRSEILGRYKSSYTSGKANKANEFLCGLVNDTETGEVNKYRIDIDKFIYSKILKSDISKKYQYDIYDSGTLTKTIVLEMNEHNLLPFPQTGVNWGRFGTRDTGGDNWVDEKVCAALLGFFYSLPKNNYLGTLYFNDISANDSRNIGHAGHRIGNDIDIRYPGSSNSAGGVLWSKAAESFISQEKFIEVLENILDISSKWGFNKNYAYKVGIKNTTGVATSIHQDHFHLGLR